MPQKILTYGINSGNWIKVLNIHIHGSEEVVLNFVCCHRQKKGSFFPGLTTNENSNLFVVMFGLATANIKPYKLELTTLIFTENMKGQLNSRRQKCILKLHL